MRLTLGKGEVCFCNAVANEQGATDVNFKLNLCYTLAPHRAVHLIKDPGLHVAVKVKIIVFASFFSKYFFGTSVKLCYYINKKYAVIRIISPHPPTAAGHIALQILFLGHPHPRYSDTAFVHPVNETSPRTLSSH